MKIIWLTLESILPANTGGRIGVFKRLEQISKTDEVFLFYPYDEISELEQVFELEKYCKKVYPYDRKKNRKHGIGKMWKFPFTVSSRDFSSMKKDILKCIKEEKIDLINVDFPHRCVNLLNLGIELPIILNEHNIEWKVYRTIAKSHKNIVKKIAYYVDSFRLRLFEKKIFNKLNISKVTFVSSKDMEFMIDKSIINNDQAELIPVGADINKISVRTHESKNIIFVGKMSYGPNVEAVTWFAKEIFPNIKIDVPDAKFYIVGKDPSNQVKLLQDENIIVTGMIDDVKDYYSIADLVVLPLKNGGGVKVKLLEAISYRIPIVSTSIGVEGTYFTNHFIPVTDDAEKFSDYCKSILKNDNLYKDQEIYKYFFQNYTWENIGKKYRKMFEGVVNER